MYARSSEKNDGTIGMDKNITVATMQFKNDVKVSTTEYLKTYYTFKLGDIAFEGHQSKEFRYGRFVENDIGNGIVSHIFAVFRPIQEYDLYFWKYAINNETLMQRILARSTKASTMMHDLVTNDFLNETFLVPSVKEQKQIGAFLNKLDNLITLHQYKLYMGVYRKGTILTYFWEQRKLDEISAKYKNSIVDGPFGSDLKTADYTDTGVLVMQSNYITSGNFDIKQPYYVSEEKAKRLERCHCKGGDILIAKIGANFGICNIIPKNIEDAVLSSNCMKVDLDDEHDNNFYKQYFNILYESGYYYSLVGITAQPALSLKFIKSLVVPSPSFEEQKKISKYFINLDNLITLHQRKIKYILKEVFIWIILIKRVVLKKPLSLSYRIMVGRKKLLSILQNRI